MRRTRGYCLNGFEQLTYLLAYLDEEARDHAVQQHVGEEAAAHLGGTVRRDRTPGWFAHPARIRGPWGQVALCLSSAYQPGRLVREARGVVSA